LKKNSLNRAEILGFEEYPQGRWRVRDLVIRLNTEKHELRAVILTEEASGEEFHLLTNLWAVGAEALWWLYEARPDGRSKPCSGR